MKNILNENAEHALWGERTHSQQPARAARWRKPSTTAFRQSAPCDSLHQMKLKKCRLALQEAIGMSFAPIATRAHAYNAPLSVLSLRRKGRKKSNFHCVYWQNEVEGRLKGEWRKSRWTAFLLSTSPLIHGTAQLGVSGRSRRKTLLSRWRIFLMRF